MQPYFQTNNTNITQFDSIRFVIAIFVIIVHHQFTNINIPFAFAYMAMHIFFIMSAFLISRGLLLSKSKAQTFSLFFKDFYKKNFKNISGIFCLSVFSNRNIYCVIFIKIWRHIKNNY